MRKRWKFDPFPFVMVWLFGGWVPWMVAVTLWGGCDSLGCGMNAGRLNTVGIVGLCLWLGPFLLAIGGGFVVLAVVAMWSARPRRVVEPITTDLRERSELA